MESSPEVRITAAQNQLLDVHTTVKTLDLEAA
jgi:hypothetical protein